MDEKQGSIWRSALSAGLIAGGVSLLLSLVGMVEAFNETDIISGIFSMGQFLLLAPLLVGGYMTLSGSKSILRQGTAWWCTGWFLWWLCIVCFSSNWSASRLAPDVPQRLSRTLQHHSFWR